MIELEPRRAAVTITTPSGGSTTVPRGHVRVVAGVAEYQRRRFNRPPGPELLTAQVVELREVGRSLELVMADGSVWNLAAGGCGCGGG